MKKKFWMRPQKRVQDKGQTRIGHEQEISNLEVSTAPQVTSAAYVSMGSASFSAWVVGGTSGQDAVTTIAVPSLEMNAAACLATVLDSLKRAGELADYYVGETEGDTIYAYGQVPSEELDAYVNVRQKVRQATRDLSFRIDLSLDTDALVK